MALAKSSSRSWSAGSQRRVAGSRPISTPMSEPPARMTARKGRETPGTTSSSSTMDGSPTTTVASIKRERRRRIRRRPIDQRLHVVARRDLVDRREDPPELPVAPPEVGGQSVVAVGQSRELVVAGDPDRGREVAGRHPVHGRHDGAERGGQLGRQGVRGEDRERQHDGDREQQDPADRLVRDLEAERRLEDQHDQPERGQRQDRRHDERDGEPGPEAQPGGRLRPAAPPQSPGGLDGLPGVATSR